MKLRTVIDSVMLDAPDAPFSVRGVKILRLLDTDGNELELLLSEGVQKTLQLIFTTE